MDGVKSPERSLARGDDIFGRFSGGLSGRRSVTPSSARFHPRLEIGDIAGRQLTGRRHLEPRVSLADRLNQQTVFRIAGHDRGAGIAALKYRCPRIEPQAPFLLFITMTCVAMLGEHGANSLFEERRLVGGN